MKTYIELLVQGGALGKTLEFPGRGNDALLVKELVERYAMARSGAKGLAEKYGMFVCPACDQIYDLNQLQGIYCEACNAEGDAAQVESRTLGEKEEA